MELFAVRPGWITENIFIDIVIIAAVCALVGVALHEFGVKIPAWVVRCFWIVVIAFVVILCIRAVMSM